MSKFEDNLKPLFDFLENLRGNSFQKLLLVWFFPVKKAILSSRQITLAILLYEQFYTSHTDHFTPQHTALEHPAACLSVVFELPPGFILFTILRHAGGTLERIIYINMNYNYPTTIWGSIYAQMYKLLVEKYIFPVFAYKVFKVKGQKCK